MPQIPLGDIVNVSHTGLTDGNGYIVGSPPVWSDDSDATYAEFAGQYSTGNPQFTGSASVGIDPPEWLPSRIRAVRVRLRVASVLGTNVRYPRVEIVLTEDRRLYANPTSITPTSPEWIEIPLEESGANALDRFADTVHLGGLTLSLYGAFYGGIYGGTVPASETQRWQVYEAELWADPFGGAPPCRLFPRDDGLGVGGGRHFPPPRSQQRSGRRFGYY